MSTPAPTGPNNRKLPATVRAYLARNGEKGGKAVPPERRYRLTPQQAREAGLKGAAVRRARAQEERQEALLERIRRAHGKGLEP